MRRIASLAAMAALAVALTGCLGGEEPAKPPTDDCPPGSNTTGNMSGNATYGNSTGGLYGNATVDDCPPEETNRTTGGMVP